MKIRKSLMLMGVATFPFRTLAYDCISCSPGTYSDGTMMECKKCPAGKYCPNGIPNDCTAGSHCPEGSSAPTICSVGNKCPIGSGSQTKCTSGENCPQGTDTPTPCPAGKYCPNGIPNDCTAGSYCPEGSSAPTFCPAWSNSTNPAKPCKTFDEINTVDVRVSEVYLGGSTNLLLDPGVYLVLLGGGNGGNAGIDRGSSPCAAGAKGALLKYKFKVEKQGTYHLLSGEHGDNGKGVGGGGGGARSQFVITGGSINYTAGGGGGGGGIHNKHWNGGQGGGIGGGGGGSGAGEAGNCGGRGGNAGGAQKGGPASCSEYGNNGYESGAGAGKPKANNLYGGMGATDGVCAMEGTSSHSSNTNIDRLANNSSVVLYKLK